MHKKDHLQGRTHDSARNAGTRPADRREPERRDQGGRRRAGEETLVLQDEEPELELPR